MSWAHHQKGNIVAEPTYSSADAARIAAEKSSAAKAAAAAKANAKAKEVQDFLNGIFGATGKLKVDFDGYGNLQLQQQIRDKTGKPTGEFQIVYFWPATNVEDSLILNAGEVVAKVKGSYGKNQESLRKMLYERGFMGEKDYVTRSESAFNAAILKSANEHSVENVQKFTVNGQTNFSDYAPWLSGKIAYSSGGSDIDTEKVSTPKSETDQDINEFFVSMLSRDATEDEKTKYFNAVQLAEKNAQRKSKVSGSTVTVTDTRLTEQDYARIKASILKPSVLGTPLEKITEGNGSIAQAVTTLKQYASDYGINRTPKELLDDVLEGLKVGGTLTEGSLDQQKQKIRTLSKARYANISNLLDEGVKVSDIANQFAYYKGRLLEMPDNAVSIFDEDIQQALDNKDANGKSQGGVMSLTDYEKLLRTNPKTKGLWLKTTKAKEEASGYALNILRTFGLIG
jgi:hypothetical protein